MQAPRMALAPKDWVQSCNRRKRHSLCAVEAITPQPQTHNPEPLTVIVADGSKRRADQRLAGGGQRPVQQRLDGVGGAGSKDLVVGFVGDLAVAVHA